MVSRERERTGSTKSVQSWQDIGIRTGDGSSSGYDAEAERICWDTETATLGTVTRLKVNGEGGEETLAGCRNCRILWILSIINQEVEGKGPQTIMGYDCSSPRDLKIWDASTRCKDGAERAMEEQEVTIVQKMAEQWLTGFKCRSSYTRRVITEGSCPIRSQGNSDDSDGAEYVRKHNQHFLPIFKWACRVVNIFISCYTGYILFWYKNCRLCCTNC